jgi:uncharacterized DUF497 family protein
VQYEWDNGKAAENLRKHGVDFADAIAALEDLNRLEEIDLQFVYDEEWIQVIGMAQDDVLFVTVTLRGEDSCISARKATRHETGTTRVTVKPGDTLPRGDTDWARLDAMTDEEVVAAALSDPDAQPLTPEQLAKMGRVSRGEDTAATPRHDADAIRRDISPAHHYATRLGATSKHARCASPGAAASNRTRPGTHAAVAGGNSRVVSHRQSRLGGSNHSATAKQ